MIARLLLVLTFCALSALIPASALAASQEKDDADDGVTEIFYNHQNDIRRIRIDQDAATTTVTLGMETGSFYTPFDRVELLIDANADKKSDYTVSFGGRDGRISESLPVLAAVRTTPDSQLNCQVTAASRDITTAPSVHSGQLSHTVQDGLQTWTYSFPTSALGGATRFGWAAYGYTFSFTRSTFDYLPDAANPLPGRPNPGGVDDGCDSNGDGIYGDVGASAEDGFLPVAMDGGFDFPDEADREAPAPGGSGGSGGGGGGGSDGGISSRFPDLANTDTTRATTMPKVLKLRSDKARAKVLRQLGHADFTVKETNPKRPPKGVGFGDVMAQSPAPRTALTAGVNDRPQVELEVYAGPKPKGRYDCLDRLSKQVKGMEMGLAADLLKKAGCKVSYDFKLGGGSKTVVRKVEPQRKDRVELTVQVPRDPNHHDLFLTFRESPNGISFDASDWTLTADDRTRNYITMQVVDRSGRLVENAQLRIDTSDVGGRDPNVAPTDGKGERSTSFAAHKRGTVDVVVWATGANDVTIYGGAQLTIKDRKSMKVGETFDTTSGRTIKKTRHGFVAVKTNSARTTARSARAFDFGGLLGWFQQLIGGSPRVESQLAAGGSPQRQVRQLGSGQRPLFPAILAVGGKPLGKGNTELIAPSRGRSALIGHAGGNLIGHAGGNLISDKGLGLRTVSASGLMAVGNGQLISDQGAGVVDARTSRIIDTDGGSLISDKGLGLISDKGLGITAVDRGNLISLESGNLISDKGIG